MSRDLKDNLSEKAYETFMLLIDKSKKYEAKYLFEACSQHTNYAMEKFKENPIIDFETAEKIDIAFKAVEKNWDSFSEQAKSYFKAAMYYFAISEDDEPDFESITGFDDDVEAINACIKYASLDDALISLKN